jgi:hypothetical protein
MQDLLILRMLHIEVVTGLAQRSNTNNCSCNMLSDIQIS